MDKSDHLETECRRSPSFPNNDNEWCAFCLRGQACLVIVEHVKQAIAGDNQELVQCSDVVLCDLWFW